MRLRKRAYLSDFLFSFIIGTLYSFALTSAIVASTVLEIPLRAQLILCAAFILFWYVIFFNNYTFFTVVGCGAVALLIIYFYLRYHEFDISWFQRLKNIGIDMFLFITHQIGYRPAFSAYFGVIICMAVALIMSVNTQVLFNFYIQTILGLVILFLPVVYDWGRSPISVPLFTVCFLVCLAKEMNLLSIVRKGEWEQSNDFYSLALLPVILVLFLASWAMPKPSIEGLSLEDGAGGFWNTPDYLPFDIGTTPMTYTEEGSQMGGPVTLNDEYVMDVDAEEGLYLSGSVRDSYDGSSWRRSTAALEELSANDAGVYKTVEYSDALWNQIQYYMRYYGRSVRTVSITTGEKRMTSIYTPAFRSSLLFSDEQAALELDRFGTIRARRPLPAVTSYVQEYISWEYDNAYFAGILQAYAAQNTAGCLTEDELAPYLRLPDSLPERVADLARQLTAGYTNDYDRLKALESYLTSFPYTLEPNNVPTDRDFVDYFLFTGQEGYCVYYASALAVMGRTLGIPTRYVEGFTLPNERNNQGTFTVTNAQAHAWVEAYFPGFGWVQFEPTAANYNDLYDEPAPAPAPLPDPETPEREDPEQPEDVDTDRDTTPEDSIEIPQREFRLPVAVIVLLILLAVAAIAAFVLYRILLHHKRRLARIERQPNEEAVVSYFTYLLWAAKHCGFPIHANETAVAYAGRVESRLKLESASLPLMAEVFSRAAYSWNKISDDERAQVKAGCYEMLERLRERYKPSLSRGDDSDENGGDPQELPAQPED